MNVRRQIFVSTGIIGAMLALSAWAWGRAPERLVVRWNMHGEPAGTMARGLALVIVPLVSILVSAFFAGLPALMPARSRLERSGVAWTAIWMVVLANMLLSHILLVAYNLGAPLDVARVCAFGTAVVVFVIGNWLGKLRYNFLFGIRTPWTLADERVWDKTHRLGGRLMVLSAIILAAATFALPAGSPMNPVLYAIELACIAAAPVAAIVYSALITRPAVPTSHE